jgi:hypothetical protein
VVDSAFQADAFQNDAFQIEGEAPPTPTPPGIGTTGRRPFPGPPAVRPNDDDEVLAAVLAAWTALHQRRP